jgi:succinoglycan biosynthesis protein ExoW
MARGRWAVRPMPLMPATVEDPRPTSPIGVVIPYFQREAGLLERALQSVAAQSCPPRQVVVVDDGAPRAAADEISAALRAQLPQLTVIRQANGGAAAARNTGLDALAGEVGAVAFLDSDDYWQPWHVANATAALARGTDFYFANFIREQSARDAWQESGYPDLSAAVAVDGLHDVRRWTAGASALLTPGPPFATSTVVYRRALMPQLRFSDAYRRAGEDAIAWWDLLVRASVVMFCPRPSAVFGHGISIWSSSTFGTAANLVRLADEIAFRRRIVRDYPLADADRRVFLDAIAERRAITLASTLHLLRRRQDVRAGIGYLLRSDPACALSWVAALPRLVWSRLRSSFAG